MNVAISEGEFMAEDSYVYFMAAWRHFMRQTKYTQIKISEKTGASKQWINCAFKERPDAKTGRVPRVSSELQEQIAEIFGYSFLDFLQAGKRVIEGIPGVKIETQEESSLQPPPLAAPPAPTSIPGVEAGYVSPFDVVTAVNVLAKQFDKANERLHCWMAIFESWPTAALIIKNGIVVRQNARSLAWGSVSGKVLCDACLGRLECDKATCPVSIAAATREHAAGYRMANGQRFRLDVAPLRHADSEYLIVSATEAPYSTHNEGERRHGAEDRRE